MTSSQLGLWSNCGSASVNVTGVYQADYLKGDVVRLRKLIPGIERLALPSDDSSTGRAKAKEITRLVR